MRGRHSLLSTRKIHASADESKISVARIVNEVEELSDFTGTALLQQARVHMA